jgi:hypothetical protein
MDSEEMWAGFNCLGIGPVVGFCEHSNEPSGSIVSVVFTDWLRNCQLIEMQLDVL